MTQKMIEQIIEGSRNRGSYAQYMYEEFGIEMPKYKPMTRKQKLRAKWNDYKNRSRKIWQIICRGYCDEESE